MNNVHSRGIKSPRGKYEIWFTMLILSKREMRYFIINFNPNREPAVDSTIRKYCFVKTAKNRGNHQ